MKIGINGTGLVRFASVERIVQDAWRAKNDGFASYWLAEHPVGGLDALTVLAAVGSQVKGLELGSAIVPTWPRHPMALAGQALTTQQLLDRPLVLGIGLSHKVMLEQLGMTGEKPIRHLREYLTILDALLSEGRCDFEGEELTCRTELFEQRESNGFVPQVVAAALGPQALRVSGRLAAGTILAWVGAKTIREHIVPTLFEAADAAGNGAPRVIATLPVVVTDDPSAARARGTQAFQMYGSLPSYRAMLEREGVSSPEELILAGSESEVTDRMHELAAAGVTDFAASEFGYGEDERNRTRTLLVEKIASF